MMQTYLINIFWFCLILFVLALTVAVVQIVIILVDIRQTTKEVKKMTKEIETKIKTVTSVIDIATLFMGGMKEAKKRAIKHALPSKSTLAGLFSGIKKGLDVLLGGEKKK